MVIDLFITSYLAVFPWVFGIVAGMVFFITAGWTFLVTIDAAGKRWPYAVVCAVSLGLLVGAVGGGIKSLLIALPFALIHMIF